MIRVLHIYANSNKTGMFSEGDGSNPDVATGNGTTGFTADRAIYIGNDSTVKRYENVVITAVNDDANVDIKFAPDVAGSPGTFSDSLNVGNIAASGQSGDVVKIWRRVIVAPGQDSQNRTNIDYKITAVEYAI